MKDDAIVEHLIEIKERLAAIETKVDTLPAVSTKVDEIELKVERAEASLKAVRWVMGGLLVAVPATAAAIAKVWKG